MGVSCRSPILLSPGKELGTHCIRGCAGAEGGVSRCGFDPRIVQPVTSHYIDWAIEAYDQSVYPLIVIKYLVFALKLVLHKTESPQLPGKFKGREDRVLRGQRDEGRTRKGSICVDPGSGVSERVLLSRRHTFVASTSEKQQTQLIDSWVICNYNGYEPFKD
jgi:hypothetical protein